MSTIAYRPLARVSAIGAGDRPLASLHFTPTASTERLLSRYRLHFRSNPGGFRVAAQHDLGAGTGMVVPLGSEPLPLLFAINSSEPDFLARHAKTASSTGLPHIFLTNRSAAGVPQAGPGLTREAEVGPKDMGRIVPRVHRARVALKPAPRPKSLELRAYFGGDKLGEPIPVEAPVGAEAADVSVDAATPAATAAGIAFILRPKPQGADQLLIADDELARMNAIGALELVLKPFPGTAPAEGRTFTATFET